MSAVGAPAPPPPLPAASGGAAATASVPETSSWCQPASTTAEAAAPAAPPVQPAGAPENQAAMRRALAAMQTCMNELGAQSAAVPGLATMVSMLGNAVDAGKNQLLEAQPLAKRIAGTKAFIERRKKRLQSVTEQAIELQKECQTLQHIIARNEQLLASLEAQATAAAAAAAPAPLDPRLAVLLGRLQQEAANPLVASILSEAGLPGGPAPVPSGPVQEAAPYAAVAQPGHVTAGPAITGPQFFPFMGSVDAVETDGYEDYSMLNLPAAPADADGVAAASAPTKSAAKKASSASTSASSAGAVKSKCAKSLDVKGSRKTLQPFAAPATSKGGRPPSMPAPPAAVAVAASDDEEDLEEGEASAAPGGAIGSGEAVGVEAAEAAAHAAVFQVATAATAAP